MEVDLLLLLLSDLHKQKTYEDPDYLAHATDDTYKDAECSGEPHGSYGDDEAALLNSKLHGQEPDEIGQQRGKREYQYGVEEGKRQARQPASAVDAEEQQHEHYLETLYDA